METLAKTLEVSKPTVGFWEKGDRTIKHHDLARLCSALGVSADELLFDTRVWPFNGLDADKVAQLEREDIQMLQGAMLAVAAQLGVDIAKVPGEDSPYKTSSNVDVAHVLSDAPVQDVTSSPSSRGFVTKGAKPWGRKSEGISPPAKSVDMQSQTPGAQSVLNEPGAKKLGKGKTK